MINESNQNDIDVDELLDILNNPERKHQERRDKTAVTAFIRHNKIESGDVKVPTHIIFYKYIQWAIAKGYKKWGYTEFFRTFGKYFKQIRTNKQRYYLLNNVFDLSLQNELRALRHKRLFTGSKANNKHNNEKKVKTN